MGKGVSKLHASPLVRLCKERKEFIKAAKYCRYDLVTAFVVYLESLLELGNALNAYVEQELVIFGECSPHVSLSDFDSSEEEDSHLEFPSSDSEFDLDSLFHHSHCDEEEPRGLFHDSPEVQDDSYTCKDHSAANMDIKYNMKNRGKPRVKSTSQEWSNLSSKFPPHSNQKNTHIHVTMSRDEDLGHYEHSQGMSSGNRWETLQSDDWFPQQENQDYFGAPMSFSYYNDRFVHYGAEAFSKDVPHNHVESQKHGTEQNCTATALPTPPPPPQVSTWDFLYPFSMNYDVYYDHDHDVREVREREGIPDLEDEKKTEKSSAVSSVVFDEKEMESGRTHGMNFDVHCDSDHNVREERERERVPDLEDEKKTEKSSAVSSVVFDERERESGMRHGSSGNGTSNVTQLNPNEDALSTKGKELVIWKKATEKKIKHNLEPKKEKDVWSGAEETTVKGRMGLKEAVLDIRNEFNYVFDCGKEFSSIVEVGKLPRQPISTKLRGFASCVLGLIIPSVLMQMCRSPSYMLYQPVSRERLLSNADMRNNQDHVCIGDLSSTLERLYVWEKKLYREVMVEEKLRIPYDKQCKRLKKLDDRGSESDKIDDTLASIKLLHSEINVAVASISVISREIHELRDNMLLPELNKLIEGLFRLWKVMSTCHQKQFQAITKAKSHVHILDPENRKKSSLKATLRLEKVILKWGMCFSNFINAQKAFLKHLNDWLLRYILQEPGETEDGIGPSLPSDIGAPPIFRICNDWYHALDKISETGVSKAISNFASSLHQLYEKLEEEQTLKVKVKDLLKDYQHRLQSFCNKNGINSHQYISFINMKASENFVEAEVPLLSESDENLANSRKRLIEQRKRHQQVIKHVNDVASSCLQKGISPIFEALGSFCLENLKIYEQLTPMNK